MLGTDKVIRHSSHEMKSFSACYTFLILLFGITVSQGARAQPVILWAETSTEVRSVNAGDIVTFTIVLENDSAVATATNPVVSVNLPTGASNVTSPDCVVLDTTTLICALAELAPQASANFSFTAALNSEGHNVVEALVSVDQENFIPEWRSSDTGTSIVVVTTEEELRDFSPVDLSIEIDISLSTELNIPYPAIVTLKNLHNTNTVIAPTIKLTTPKGWTIWPGKHCEPTGRRVNSGEVVRCATAPLLPQSASELTLFYTPVAIDGSGSLNALASSTQSEENELDNSANSDVTIVPTVFHEVLCGASNPLCSGAPDSNTDNSPDTDSPGIETQESAAATSGNSGGGTLTFSLLLVVSGFNFFRCRKHLGFY